jgi:hypothetical protein
MAIHLGGKEENICTNIKSLVKSRFTKILFLDNQLRKQRKRKLISHSIDFESQRSKVEVEVEVEVEVYAHSHLVKMKKGSHSEDTSVLSKCL